jgi:GAF domain-containing protein
MAARFRALAAVARVSTTTTGPNLLREVARAAREALDGASVSLSRWEPESGLLRCLINEGDLGPSEVPEPVDETYSMLAYRNMAVLIEDQAALVASVDQDDGDGGYVRMLTELHKGSCVAAPIPLDGRVWGELFVTRTLDQAPFTDSDGDLAVAVAAQVGAAIATAEHLVRVERLARTDPLTGLANRRAVDDRPRRAAALGAVLRSVGQAEQPTSVGHLADVVTGGGDTARDALQRRALDGSAQVVRGRDDLVGRQPAHDDAELVTAQPRRKSTGQ